MAINVYQVQSPLSQVTAEHTEAYLSSVSAALGEPLVRVSLDEFAAEGFGLVYVASGGSEGIFLENYGRIAEKPCYILTSGESNSLAASMEILSYLKRNGRPGEILHGSLSLIAGRINALRRAAEARKALSGMRLGVVGEPSDWLIASDTDGAAYERRLGLSLVRVPIEELISETKAGGYEQNGWTERLTAFGYDRAEMEKALSVYGALKRIINKYGLGAVTVRCFDLLGSVHTTGCLALAILNAEGIYAGCEGDIPSAVSMAILGAVSLEPVFLCNPSRIDADACELVLAHCTLPVNMPDAMRLTTHYESDIGVAIAGHIREGVCTIFKTSADLSRFFAKRAKLTENLSETNLCRTQIKLKLDDISYFLTDPINNHHLVCRGDHVEAIKELFAQL